MTRPYVMTQMMTRAAQVPELPRELLAPELLLVTARDQCAASPVPPFYQYMRAKLVGYVTILQVHKWSGG